MVKFPKSAFAIKHAGLVSSGGKGSQSLLHYAKINQTKKNDTKLENYENISIYCTHYFVQSQS